MDSLFEHAPVPMWLVDYSAARPLIEPLLTEGYEAVLARLEADAELSQACCEAVQVVDANRAVLKLFNRRDVSEVRGPLVRLLPPQSYTELAMEVAAIATGRLPTHHSDVVVLVDGAEVELGLHLSMIDPDDWSRVIVATIDQTPRTQASRALRESEERFRTICEHAPVMIDEFDGEGHCLLWNRECEERLGWTQDEIEAHGDPLSLFYPAQVDRDRVLESITRADGEFREYRVLAKSGEHRDQLWADFRLPSGAQISVGHDITDLREAERKERRFEEQMRQTQKLESLGVLAGGIAHDFNNLLVGVLGSADLARTSPPEDRARLLDEIIDSARRAAELANQMLAYSGKAKLTRERVDLAKLVNELSPMIAAVTSKDVRIRYEIARDLDVQGDATQLRQVVFNLILNGAEALGDGPGTVRVRLGLERRDSVATNAVVVDESLAAGDYACVEVTDDGAGMDEATRARMFDPFFTTKFTGRGLGLASVLGIVRSHGGVIEVETALGEGTTCRVLLPAAQREIKDAAPDDRPRPATEPMRFLVVDDEPTVRRTTALLLRSMGHEVVEAADGQEALVVFESEGDAIDMAIVDATMPNVSGPEVIVELRRRRPGLPAVLVSGYTEDDAGGDAELLRTISFLQKPYTVVELTDALQLALSRG